VDSGDVTACVFNAVVTRCHCDRSTEDIHGIVLHNLVQSTLVMSNSQMKCSRSFQVQQTCTFLCAFTNHVLPVDLLLLCPLTTMYYSMYYSYIYIYEYIYIYIQLRIFSFCSFYSYLHVLSFFFFCPHSCYCSINGKWTAFVGRLKCFTILPRVHSFIHSFIHSFDRTAQPPYLLLSCSAWPSETV